MSVTTASPESPAVPTPRLSVVTIAQNEADRIGKLLDSVKHAHEVIVVDSGSSDGTLEVCQEYGALVVHRAWQGYAPQKQTALDLASGDWILNLDADEALSAESAREISQALESVGPDIEAFSMPRLSRYLDRWIRHGGWYPDRKLRLVRRGCGRWVGDALHERLEVSGPVVALGEPILHYVYRDIDDQVETINRFSRIFAAGRSKHASGLYVIAGIFHAIGKFLECAIWKRGFMDGIPGIIIAMNSSFYVFLKHAKSWEFSETSLPNHASLHHTGKARHHD